MVHTKTVGTRKQQNSEKKWACDLGILIQPYNIITQLDQYSIVSGLLKHVIAWLNEQILIMKYNKSAYFLKFSLNVVRKLWLC